MMSLTFQSLNESHFPLLLKWLEMPHVKKWWDTDTVYTLDLIVKKYGDYVKGYKIVDGVRKSVAAYIICADQNPIGYIQLYNPYDFMKAKSLRDLPEKVGAIDLFIGEEQFLGKNIASQAILQFCYQHAERFSYVFVDPNKDNIAAIKAYEKAGFQKISLQQEPDTIWMLLKNNHK